MSSSEEQRFGQYIVTDRIGKGGMGTVYRAIQESIGREVAVKVLASTLLEEPTSRDRFWREVQVAADLQHPHIIPIYDYGEQDGVPYIVMAYVSGGSLAERIKAGALPLNEVVRLVGQIAGALDFAHAREVIHRDFKPGNILLDGQGNPYLADFGLAKFAGAKQITATDVIIGTPDYMAPEWAQKGDPGPGVDIYALGVTIYQMLTGKLPYQASTPMGVLMAHVSSPVPDVREGHPDLPSPMTAVLQKAMAKSPDQRYATASELAAGLEAAARGVPVEMPGMEPEGQYFYPNVWARQILVAAHEMLGEDALYSLLLSEAGLTRYLTSLPPDDLKKDFPFEHVGQLMGAIYRVYGLRGTQSVGKLFGHATFQSGLSRFGVLGKLVQPLRQRTPGLAKYRLGLDFFARMFNSMSDQVVEVDEDERYWMWKIVRCPICWGVQAAEPICWLVIGTLQAAFDWASGGQQQFRAVETECIAKGDLACLVLIEKAPYRISGEG